MTLYEQRVSWDMLVELWHWAEVPICDFPH
jgi:hypothetical protein